MLPSAKNLLVDDGFVDVILYGTALASRDGFLLLGGINDDLCLCNPMTGSCSFLTAARPARCSDSSSVQCTYVLATGYDDDDHSQPDCGDGGGLAPKVQVVAAVGKQNIMMYRVFSSTSGDWGPVKHSAKLGVDVVKVYIHVHTEPKHVVVCGSAVYWMVDLFTTDKGERTCIFAMDLRTERTWTTELPEECDVRHCLTCELVLATSEDGRRLSLIASQASRRQIEVWVLIGDDSRWILQQTMELQSWLLPNCRSLTYIVPKGFCPRSGFLFGVVIDDQLLYHKFVVSVDGSSPRLMQTVDSKYCYSLQYEMDWSTYISKMKYF